MTNGIEPASNGGARMERSDNVGLRVAINLGDRAHLVGGDAGSAFGDDDGDSATVDFRIDNWCCC